MRKFISVLAAALLVVALSIGAFAATYPLNNEPTFYERDGDTYIGTLITSSLTESQKDFLRAWLKSDTNMLAYSHNPALKHGTVVFYIFSSDSVLKSVGVSSTDSDWGSLQFESGAKYSFLSFDAQTGEATGNLNYCNPTGTSYSLGSPYSLGVGTIISGTIFKKFSEVSLPSSPLLDFEGALYLVDDDGLLTTEQEPSEPEIPSSSGTVHVPAGPPDFPSGQTDYLPYDVSVWGDFTNYLRTAIGSVGFILIMIVFMFILVGTVFSAIKHYVSQGKADGGSDGGLI